MIMQAVQILRGVILVHAYLDTLEMGGLVQVIDHSNFSRVIHVDTFIQMLMSVSRQLICVILMPAVQIPMGTIHVSVTLDLLEMASSAWV